MPEPTRRDRITDLGELQVEMLDALGKLSEATVYDLMDAFPPEGRPKSSTVQTVMRGLERKGLVTHRTEGRTFIYRVTEAAGEVKGRALRAVLERLFSGSPTALVATLLDVGDFTPDELAELRALVDGKGDGNGDGDTAR
jgi:predicted transcriptional regulator